MNAHAPHKGISEGYKPRIALYVQLGRIAASVAASHGNRSVLLLRRRLCGMPRARVTLWPAWRAVSLLSVGPRAAVGVLRGLRWLCRLRRELLLRSGHAIGS